MNDMFTIPLNGLTAGRKEFQWKVGKEFFDSFESDEIFDAQLDASVFAEKSGRCVNIDCDVTGTVTVECDRCLDDLDMPVDVRIRIAVRFGAGSDAGDVMEDGREVVFVPEDDTRLDMSQIIYDYVCLSLPMQRWHGPGGCNPVAMKYFSSPESADFFNEEETLNPFSTLKDMFKDY